MTNKAKIAELKGQIAEWRRQQEMLEDMISAAHERIDSLGGADYWREVFANERPIIAQH